SRGRRAVAPVPQFSEAELYIPQTETAAAATVVQERKVQQSPRDVRRTGPAYSQQPERSFQQAQMRFTSASAQEFQAPVPVKAQEYKAPTPQQEEQKQQERGGKFLKYTSEGYVPVNNNGNSKTGENLKWR
ncbi:MAG: hypothetical protein ACM3Q2_14025, partial [Syntrophothermus sp.]